MSKSTELDGYTLTSRIRKARSMYFISATAQALYYELAAIYNDCGKLEVFTYSNQALCASLGITENTLGKARQELIDADLIFYLSGKSRREFSKYSFIKPFSTTSIIDTIPDTEITTTSKIDTKSEVNTDTIPDTNAEDYNKEEIESKRIINNYKQWTEEEFLNEVEKLKEQFPEEMRTRFFEYWKEKTPKGKMKFQLENSWETHLRLNYWKNNSLKFLYDKRTNHSNPLPANGKHAGNAALLEKTRALATSYNTRGTADS